MSTIKQKFEDLLLKTKSSDLLQKKLTSLSQNQSIFEQQYIHSLNLQNKLIQTLKNLKNKPVSNIFNEVIKKPYAFSSSLLNYSQSILQHMINLEESTQQYQKDENSLHFPYLSICQKSDKSQSVLLAAYIRSLQKSVVIVTNNTHHWQSILTSSDQINPKQKTKQILDKQNIAVRPLQLFAHQEDLMDYSDISHYEFIIYDIFDTNPMDYQPFLLKNLTNNALIRQDKVIVYYSNNQLKEFQKVSQSLKCIESIFPFQLNSCHPFQFVKAEKTFENILVSFLLDQKNYPNKKDIIVFYKSEKNRNLSTYLAKLKDVLKANHVQNLVNLISQPNQMINAFQNKIFITENAKQLREWNYSYEKVFYVFDNCYQEHFYLDYKTMCYVNTIKQISSDQKTRRMNFVANYGPGRYCYVENLKSQSDIKNEILEFQSDISKYIYKMIYNGFYELILDREHPRIQDCLKLMQQSKIIEKKEEGYVIREIENRNENENEKFDLMSQINKTSLSPFFIMSSRKILFSQEKKAKNLILMALAVITTKGQLKKERKVQSKYKKPTGAWRHSGYLHSALQIITKYQYLLHIGQEQILNERKSSMRKKTSQMAQKISYQDPFGQIQDLYISAPQRKVLNEMTIQQYLKANEVNEAIFYKIYDQVERLRETFNVERAKIELNGEDVESICVNLIQFQKLNTGYYTGSSRTGYIVTGVKQGIHPHKNSLLNQTNDRPRFLFIYRLYENGQQLEIAMSNQITQADYISIFGKIPLFEKKSFAQTQIEFHGIGSALFQNIWGKYKYQIQDFQKNFNCYVDGNEQIALISIYCMKNQQNHIKDKFQAMLNKFKEQLIAGTKLMHYVGTTSVIVGSGGIALDIVKGKYLNKCLLGNLDINCTKDDLHQIFDQFFNLKQITLYEDYEKQFCKNEKTMKAVIEFCNQRDYYKFAEYYKGCVLFEREMKIQPIYGQKIESFPAEKYIRIKWFTWKSMRKALIEYENQKQAYSAIKKLEQLQFKIDDTQIKVKLSKPTQLMLEDLKPSTDEIFLQRQFNNWGTIKNIQILKSPAKQQGNEQELLNMHIQNCFPINRRRQVIFRVNPIKRKKNGLRTAKVIFQNQLHIAEVMQQMNGKIGIMGYGRIHMSNWESKSIQIPKGSVELYAELMKQVKFKIGNAIRQKKVESNDGRNYLIVKAKDPNILILFDNRFNEVSAGKPIQLSKEQTNIVLSQIGMRNLLELQQKYVCKFIPDPIAKKLTLIAPIKQYADIQKQFRARINDQFIYRVKINVKTLKYFKDNPDKCTQMAAKFQLKYFQFDQMGKTLLFQGSAFKIQEAITFLGSFIESLSNKSQEEIINADVCLICCEPPKRPYRLQACGHRFCHGCALEYIESALGDVSQFPLKCPHCMIEIVLVDVEQLIQSKNVAKWMGLLMNIYLGRNPLTYSFCFTPGCKQINLIQVDYIKCDLCNYSFCVKCKQNRHPGLTCQQAKQGLEALFKQFMEKNNVRKCPNKACQMPIVRESGCYRVTCTKCTTSMCFKCPADKMIPYKSSGDCYSHLTAEHGGYF